MECLIVKYLERDKNEWDEFVMYNSINGTFLQTRRFLEYHPKEKFLDASILIWDKGKIAAICPACTIYENEKKIFYSHKGATFGGLIINPKYFSAEKLLEILHDLEVYLVHENYDEIIMKNTPDLFAGEGKSLLDYCFFNLGYFSYPELNTYIDLQTDLI